MTATKLELHALVDQLPDGVVLMAKEILLAIISGYQTLAFQNHLNHLPDDDEPTTALDIQVFQDRKDEADIDFAEIKKEFGI